MYFTLTKNCEKLPSGNKTLQVYEYPNNKQPIILNWAKLKTQCISFGIDIKTTKTASLLLKYSKLLKYFVTHWLC